MLRSEVMVSFATPQALYIGSAIEVTSQVLRNAHMRICTMQCWRPGPEWGSHWSAGIASFVLDRGFSEFCRSSTVSLYCRTLVAVSTSVQIRQHTCQPSRFRRDCTDFDCYVPPSRYTNPLSRFYQPSGFGRDVPLPGVTFLAIPHYRAFVPL